MNRANLFLIIGLAAGTVLGLAASGSFGGFSHSGQSAEAPNMAAHDHSKMIEIPESSAPVLSAVLHHEGGCAYNLHLTVSNFRFAPENANGSHVDGEGHAHIYVDGTKLARVYSDWFHFSAPKGSKMLKVTLTANDHSALAVGGVPITSSVALTECQGA